MLPARSARNIRAMAPSKTKSPTQKSVFSRLMCVVHSNQLPNIRAVSTKSSPSTSRELCTTVRVVARDTPSGVADRKSVVEGKRDGQGGHSAVSNKAEEGEAYIR